MFECVRVFAILQHRHIIKPYLINVAAFYSGLSAETKFSAVEHIRLRFFFVFGGRWVRVCVSVCVCASVSVCACVCWRAGEQKFFGGLKVRRTTNIKLRATERERESL